MVTESVFTRQCLWFSSYKKYLNYDPFSLRCVLQYTSPCNLLLKEERKLITSHNFFFFVIQTLNMQLTSFLPQILHYKDIPLQGKPAVNHSSGMVFEEDPTNSYCSALALALWNTTKQKRELCRLAFSEESDCVKEVVDFSSPRQSSTLPDSSVSLRQNVRKCIIRSLCFPKGSLLPLGTFVECTQELKLSFMEINQQAEEKLKQLLAWMLQLCKPVESKSDEDSQSLRMYSMKGNTESLGKKVLVRVLSDSKHDLNRDNKKRARSPRATCRELPPRGWSPVVSPDVSVLSVLHRIGLLTSKNPENSTPLQVTSEGLQFCLTPRPFQRQFLFRACVSHILHEVWSFLLPRQTILQKCHESGSSLCLPPNPVPEPPKNTSQTETTEENLGHYLQDRILKFAAMLSQHCENTPYLYPKGQLLLRHFEKPQSPQNDTSGFHDPNPCLKLLRALITVWPTGPEGRLLDMLSTLGITFKGVARGVDEGYQKKIKMSPFYVVHPSLCDTSIWRDIEEDMHHPYPWANLGKTTSLKFHSKPTTDLDFFFDSYKTIPSSLQSTLRSFEESARSGNERGLSSLQIIVETNFRLYAYCHDTNHHLEEAYSKTPPWSLMYGEMVSQFAEIITNISRKASTLTDIGNPATKNPSKRDPQLEKGTRVTVLIVAQITYQSAMKAFQNGLTAQQIVQFIEYHKHVPALLASKVEDVGLGRELALPLLTSTDQHHRRIPQETSLLPPAVPSSVHEQLIQWESDSKRARLCINIPKPLLITQEGRVEQCCSGTEVTNEENFFSLEKVHDDKKDFDPRLWIPVGSGTPPWTQFLGANFQDKIKQLRIQEFVALHFRSEEERKQYMLTCPGIFVGETSPLDIIVTSEAEKG